MSSINKNIVTYKKVFTRDFTLPWIQIWYKGEAKDLKPWNSQNNKSFPYIVFVRRNHTVESYYDSVGLSWSRNSAFEQIRVNDAFINDIKTNVERRLGPILKILKKKELTDKDELLNLLDLFGEAYPWFLVMWEIGESETEEMEGLDVSQILKLKESVITLTDDLDNLIRKSLQKIYPHIAEYSDVLTIEEIRSGNLPSLEILKERENGFIYTDSKLFSITQVNEIEDKYGIELEKINIENIKEFKGKPASGGFAKGRVRKVMSIKDLEDFKIGEILVSPMTMPDFAVAMNKAIAIITDEGGITCHAAILAREFGVPCIVGTRIATQVLKNGDLIEVNADEGIIKIYDLK